MNNAPTTNPPRQILVNLGNRFVVFGSNGGLPEPIRFDPSDSPILPRVADERENPETRILETLKIYGMRKVEADNAEIGHADLAFVDAAGKRLLIDVKIRERDPRKRDLELGTRLIEDAKLKDQELEIWFFNIERLKLTIMRKETKYLHFDELVPLNVWEKTSEGVFERQKVIDEVDDWARRVHQLYADVRGWLEGDGSLVFDESRTVTMSEEMMQEFAVTDRELAVLDLLRDEQVLLSFVPRGLWLIGAWGRIDIISKSGTAVLVAIKDKEVFTWMLASSNDRRHTKLFDKETLLALVDDK
jgi:hypothetical protein